MKKRERERESRVADLCVGWPPDTGVRPAGNMPIGASWIQSLKTIIWTECVCVCVWDNIYLSGCTWATVTNYFPLTLSFIMKYTNCLHVFSQAKHTLHTHTQTHSHCMQCAKPSLASSTSWDFKGDPLSVALSQLPCSPFLFPSLTQTQRADLPNTLTHTQSTNSQNPLLFRLHFYLLRAFY